MVKFEMSASPCQADMSWRKGKTSGWAAFHLEQQRKMGLEPEAANESFPSMSSSFSKNIQNVALLEKPFKSVLQNSVNFPSLNGHVNLCKSQLAVNSSSTPMNTAELVTACTCERNANNLQEILKEIHPWADGNLIKDVLVAADNNVYKASILFEEMVFSKENHEENKGFENKALESTVEDSLVDRNELLADTTLDLAKLTCLLQEGLKSNNVEFGHEFDTDLKKILNSLRYISIEPEWEEDDVYLVHRKEALRKMRSASRHSSAAKDAYLRGDHSSAQAYSQKAREEWIVAKRLNEKAAKEILTIRNSKNDQWTLDLHGLHAAEAVSALHEHLWKIESRVPISQLVTANGVKDKSKLSKSCTLSANSGGSEKLCKQLLSSKQRPTSLQVITGKGNHSRGEAALPAAVRSFLIENRYRFDETRPGVIYVQLKFR